MVSYCNQARFNLYITVYVLYYIPYHRKYSQPEYRKAFVPFDSITSNLPTMRCAYIALIVLGAVLSTAWYKIIMQRSLVVCQGINHSRV